MKFMKFYYIITQKKKKKNCITHHITTTTTTTNVHRWKRRTATTTTNTVIGTTGMQGRDNSKGSSLACLEPIEALFFPSNLFFLYQPLFSLF